jgi:acetyl-CoA carboxylase biotin carboxyl carrier protein
MSDQETLPTPGDEQSQKARPSERGGRERSRRRHHPQQQNQPRRPEASLNMDELRELVELIAEHGFTDFELEREGFRVRLGRELAPQALAPTPSQTAGGEQPPAPASASQPPTATGGGVTTQSSGAPPAATQEADAQEAGTAPAENEGLHIIPSPIVGTFYRSPSPTAEAFVRLGSHVNPDTVVCIIEAMKLMNEIQAETSGEVVKIYVENGQPVEYNQPLFGVKK